METAPDLQLLVSFVAVAEAESFSKAASKLGVAKGTVSRAIAQLETQLGVELLHRTTHQVALSTAGSALYERTRGHITALHAAVVDLPEREEAPSGLLRMTAPPDFGAIVLPSVVAAFSRRFPSVRFDLRLTGQHVDLVKEGYDLAVRVSLGRLKDSTLTVRRIGKSTGAFYAAPSYLARCGKPKQLGDERHRFVLHPAVQRVLKVKGESVAFLVDDFLLIRDLLRDGVGVGLLPSFVARAYLREGLLEEVALAGRHPLAGEHVMLYPSSGKTPKKVTAFRDFLLEALKSGAGL
jgi:DNA-binding transcriptional LysR family regulator